MSKRSIYSFGEESPIKFEISDKLARYYNEATAEFFKSQTRFKQKFGRAWNPSKDPIEIRWNRKQRWAWNEFATVFKRALVESGPFYANDIMDDFLVKNTVEVASKSTKKSGRVLTLAVTVGALYGLLRGFNRPS